MNDVLLNKKLSIERCVARLQAYRARDLGAPLEFANIALKAAMDE